MRQLVVRLLAFVVVILVIFGLYRLITVQPLKPSDFFAQAKKSPLVIADTGRFTEAPPYTLAALDAASRPVRTGFYLPVQLDSRWRAGRPGSSRLITDHRTE